MLVVSVASVANLGVSANIAAAYHVWGTFPYVFSSTVIDY